MIGLVFFVPRNRLPENERKEAVSIRLKKEIIDQLSKHGKLQDVIEKACIQFLKKKD